MTKLLRSGAQYKKQNLVGGSSWEESKKVMW